MSADDDWRWRGHTIRHDTSDCTSTSDCDQQCDCQCHDVLNNLDTPVQDILGMQRRPS